MKIFEFRCWLWYQVWGKFDEFEEHSSKLFSFLPCVRMVKFSCECTMEKTWKKKSKILQILPTCNPLLQIQNLFELTYEWNECFFVCQNDQNSLKSPIAEKVEFLWPPPYGWRIVKILRFFQEFSREKGVSYLKG